MTTVTRRGCGVFGVAHTHGDCDCRRLLDRVAPRDTPADPTESGGRVSAVDAARQLGVAYQTFHRWVDRWGHTMGVDDPRPGTGNPRTIRSSTIPAWRTAVTLVGFGLPPSTVFALSARKRDKLRAVMALVLHEPEGADR